MTALNNLFLLLEQQLIHYRKEDFIKILSEDFLNTDHPEASWIKLT